MAPTPAIWPPALTAEPDIQGYLTDINQIGYSRDIGRSFTLGGNLYYVFGDTFCKNKSGVFVGLRDNTASMVIDKSKPAESSYLDIREDGMVEPLVPLNDEEKELQKNHPEQRVTLWCFGGVVEIDPGIGLLWYTKGIEYKIKGQPQRHEHLGTGVAKVKVDPETRKLKTKRYPGLLFPLGKHDFGGFSAIYEDGYIYGFGQKHGTCEMTIGRTTKHRFKTLEGYERWTGEGWESGGDSEPAALFKDIPQGAVFRSDLFGKQRPYVMIGVSKWADSKIRVGSAPALTGPWEVTEVGIAKGIDYANDYMYCIYPHPWALEDENALMISWSEHWPGGVVMGKLRFVPKVQPLSSTETVAKAVKGLFELCIGSGDK